MHLGYDQILQLLDTGTVDKNSSSSTRIGKANWKYFFLSTYLSPKYNFWFPKFYIWFWRRNYSGSSIRHCKSDASKITFLVVPYAKRVTLFLLCHMYILYSIWFSLFLSLPYIPLHCRDRIRAKPMWVFHLYFNQLPNELILGGILGKLRMGPEWHF